MAKKSNKLKVIPLGGLDEIGKNMTAFEYGESIIVVDCGLAFPEDEMLGIDLVIPDITYLEKNHEKLKGIVVTHGHEDHIGALPYVLKKIKTPVYGTNLTLGLIENKLIEHEMMDIVELISVKAGDIIQFRSVKITEHLPGGVTRYESLGSPDHTAIVYKVLGKKHYTVAHQNVSGNRNVITGEINLSKVTGGKYWIYRPVALMIPQ